MKQLPGIVMVVRLSGCSTMVNTALRSGPHVPSYKVLIKPKDEEQPGACEGVIGTLVVLEGLRLQGARRLGTRWPS
jgi:hypothetical protein